MSGLKRKEYTNLTGRLRPGKPNLCEATQTALEHAKTSLQQKLRWPVLGERSTCASRNPASRRAVEPRLTALLLRQPTHTDCPPCTCSPTPHPDCGRRRNDSGGYAAVGRAARTPLRRAGAMCYLPAAGVRRPGPLLAPHAYQAAAGPPPAPAHRHAPGLPNHRRTSAAFTHPIPLTFRTPCLRTTPFPYPNASSRTRPCATRST
jgi:hypothetical protein